MNYIVIKTTAELEDYIQNLDQPKIVAIDTEFTRVSTYYPKLCLLQACFKENEAIIIDCLAEDINLKPILKIIYNKNIVKVIHSSFQDIEILFNITKNVPLNIFDTQIGALALGYSSYLSYEKLILYTLNVKLNKGMKVSNWSKRPLSNNQLQYAANDVLYLYKAYLYMIEKLQESNRAGWLTDNLKEIESPALYKFDPIKICKRIVSSAFSTRQIAICLKLVKWREDRAVELNVPRSKVLGNELIKTLSKEKADEVIRVELNKNKIKVEYHDQLSSIIVNITEEEISAISISSFVEKPATAIETQLTFMLSILLDISAKKVHINSLLIATQKDLLNFVRKYQKESVNIFSDWRYEIFGKDAEGFLNGDFGIFYKDNSLIVK